MSENKESEKSRNKDDYVDRKIRRRVDILAEEVDEETVLFDPRNKNIYALNQMASIIWELCDGEHTPTEISAEISSVLNVDLGRVLNDVLKTVGDFLDKGLVEIIV
jgi:hypothetical protein